MNTTPVEMQTLERRQQCLNLRLAGFTYGEIGEQVGISKQAAWKHVKTALEEMHSENNALAKRYRDIELARLDKLLLQLWPCACKGDMQAAGQIHKNIEVRAKLLGLNAPSEVKLTAESPSDILARMRDNAKDAD